MPRQRRRRRRRAQTTAGAPRAASGPGAGGPPQSETDGRPWWRPTLTVVVAFSAGLWLGVTLSFGDTTAFAGLLVGAAGLGLGGSRLLSNRLRRQRLRRRESRQAGEISDASAPGARDGRDR